MQFAFATEADVRALLGAARKHARETGPGLASALLLHGLLVALIILMHMQFAAPARPTALSVVPVDVVQFGEETTSPPATLKSVVPQQKRVPTRKQEEASPVPPHGVSPNGTKPVPVDNLDAKLRALARLRQPDTAPSVIDKIGRAHV